MILGYKRDADSATYTVVLRRMFTQPVMAIYYADVTGDGLCELVVRTGSGIHILQVCVDFLIFFYHANNEKLQHDLELAAQTVAART
jgi:hypothetical protein